MRVRLVQDDPVRGDVASNAAAVRDATVAAREDGVDLLAFPELFLTGYHLDRAAFTGRRDAVAEALKEVRAASDGLVLVVGAPTYDGERLYNAAVVFDHGERAGVYRKTHRYGGEEDVFDAGNALEPVETTAGTLGVEICYDLEFPEVARRLSLSGAELLLTVSANMRPFASYQRTYVRSRAMENAVPHALVNRVGRERDDDFFGGSAIVDVRGEHLACADEDVRTTVTAEIDPTASADESLSYLTDRRADLF